MFGQLIPAGGGDPIPLLKKALQIGRVESNDIVLKFPNVSSRHCNLSLDAGYWFVTDLDSSNGTKVNGVRILRKRLDPGDELTVAKHKYQIDYSPTDCGAAGPPPPDEDEIAQIMSASLLQRAGLNRRQSQEKAAQERQQKVDRKNLKNHDQIQVRRKTEDD